MTDDRPQCIWVVVVALCYDGCVCVGVGACVGVRECVGVGEQAVEVVVVVAVVDWGRSSPLRMRSL